ncbi:hypothetical protein UFOVP73_12 [uncultured Caudovirales phage]|uniref:Uncharacterized protein n=1 Tax=uncultured Caudovirales phage TaxID=2100421 RepID=A0A6J7WF60_9CAUD|nr:hypothetical protein UFOVP73_12 [uncultured Caudovirales phage]CAB5194945.1 hypothetical protein UFOVP170_34 [uncultured Caudovirales phage]
MIKIEGNAYKFDEGTLLSTAIRLDGSIDPDWYEVSEEDEQTAQARVLLKAQLALSVEVAVAVLHVANYAWAGDMDNQVLFDELSEAASQLFKAKRAARAAG